MSERAELQKSVGMYPHELVQVVACLCHQVFLLLQILKFLERK